MKATTVKWISTAVAVLVLIGTIGFVMAEEQKGPKPVTGSIVSVNTADNTFVMSVKRDSATENWTVGVNKRTRIAEGLDKREFKDLAVGKTVNVIGQADVNEHKIIAEVVFIGDIPAKPPRPVYGKVTEVSASNFKLEVGKDVWTVTWTYKTKWISDNVAFNGAKDLKVDDRIGVSGTANKDAKTIEAIIVTSGMVDDERGPGGMYGTGIVKSIDKNASTFTYDVSGTIYTVTITDRTRWEVVGNKGFTGLAVGDEITVFGFFNKEAKTAEAHNIMWGKPTPPQDRMPQMIRGVVSAIDKNAKTFKLTMESKEGEKHEITVVWSEKTKFLLGKDAKTEADLAEGKTIMVMGFNDSEKKVLNAIMIQLDGNMKPPDGFMKRIKERMKDIGGKIRDGHPGRKGH